MASNDLRDKIIMPTIYILLFIFYIFEQYFKRDHSYPPVLVHGSNSQFFPFSKQPFEISPQLNLNFSPFFIPYVASICKTAAMDTSAQNIDSIFFELTHHFQKLFFSFLPIIYCLSLTRIGNCLFANSRTSTSSVSPCTQG